MSIQRYELKAIVEEYVDLKSLNPKPLFETLDFLFAICGEKLTCAPKTPPDLCRVRPTKGRTHEGTIYGRTDHSDDQGTGIW
jgi:hypothetical protein